MPIIIITLIIYLWYTLQFNSIRVIFVIQICLLFKIWLTIITTNANYYYYYYGINYKNIIIME